jgi:hypothetical protein
MRSLLPFLAICSSTVAYTCSGLPKTVSLQWSFGWKWISPDGFGRSVVAVNNQWPPPTIDMCKGDRLVVQVTNNLGNETASIHFHGLYQKGQNQMDGPVMTTQCPIPQGSVFTYDFIVGSLFPPLSRRLQQGPRQDTCRSSERTSTKTSRRLNNKLGHTGGTVTSTARLPTVCEVL